MAKLRRHIKEVHWQKHDYYSCSECARASLRRPDVQRHCSAACHDAVHSVHTEERLDALQKCNECCFVGIISTGTTAERDCTNTKVTCSVPHRDRTLMPAYQQTGAPIAMFPLFLRVGTLRLPPPSVTPTMVLRPLLLLTAPTTVWLRLPLLLLKAPTTDLLDLSVECFDETRLPRVTVQFDVADLEDGSVNLVMSDFDRDSMCEISDFVLE